MDYLYYHFEERKTLFTIKYNVYFDENSPTYSLKHN